MRQFLLPVIVLMLCTGPARGQNVAPSTFGQRPVGQVRTVEQAESPIEITVFSAGYSERSSYSTQGIRYSVTYKNRAAKPIVAVQFGLVAFDIWNEFLDKTGGIAMTRLAPGESTNSVWVASRYADFSFHTGVAYVHRVRFDDGAIWSGDLNVVLQELKKIEKDFDAARLKAQPEKP